jgi:hypothetical protein
LPSGSHQGSWKSSKRKLEALTGDGTQQGFISKKKIKYQNQTKQIMGFQMTNELVKLDIYKD